jgi:hypothetical protein
MIHLFSRSVTRHYRDFSLWIRLLVQALAQRFARNQKSAHP